MAIKSDFRMPSSDDPDAAHRILVDMSMGAAGFTGIPHETRLLLNSLWRTNGLSPTGLLFDEGIGVLSHRFASRPQQRMENHAVFLHQIAQPAASASTFMA